MMTQLSSIEVGHQVSKVRFHPSLPLIVALSAEDDRISCWRYSDDGSIRVEWQTAATSAAQYRMLDFAFIPRGNLLASVGRLKKIQIRRIKSGKVLYECGPLPRNEFSEYSGYDSTCYLEKSLLVASEIVSRCAFLFDVQSKRRIRSFGSSAMTDITLHPERVLLGSVISGTNSSTIQFFHFDSGNRRLRLCNTELSVRQLIRGARFSSTGDCVLLIGGIPPVVVVLLTFPDFHPILYRRSRLSMSSRKPYPLFFPVSIEEGDYSDEMPVVENAAFVNRQLLFPDESGQLVWYSVPDRRVVQSVSTNSRHIITSLHPHPMKPLGVTVNTAGTLRLWTMPLDKTRPRLRRKPITEAFLDRHGVSSRSNGWADNTIVVDDLFS
jgi:WD40 repeat protein